MSVELVKQALRRFLADPTPEVLCIKGKWGTGKTHAWDSAVREAKANNAMAIKQYAYVSLFGMTDSSDIMQSICVNTDHINVPNNSIVTKEKINAIANRVKRVFAFASEHANAPYISGLGGVARAVINNSVNNTVVCVDDFERRSRNISVNDIMGTIAQLRDARKCKVVLILNSDTLDSEELAEFTKYSEKVINWSLHFDPTPEESTIIALPDNDDLSDELREACRQLEITNIRVIYKIKGFATRLVELLRGVDEAVVSRVMRSLVVIVWSIVSPKDEGAASLDFIKHHNRRSDYLTKKESKPTPEEYRLASLLDRYGFSYFDEFDQSLVDDVTNGFFNDEKIRAAAVKYLKDAEKERADAALEAAWIPYHASFHDNPAEVARAMFEGTRNNVKYTSEMNLSIAVMILKDIGFADLASQLIEAFITSRGEGYLFDRNTSPWGNMVVDPDVIKAIETATSNNIASILTVRQAAEMLYHNKWTVEAEEAVANTSVDDLVSLFKSTDGKEHEIIIRGCLSYQRVMNSSERQLKITKNATAALLKIGYESPLNAHRMAKYGINVKFEKEKPDVPNDVG